MPELTEQKFVLNPFRQEERIYKTGDLGRWLPNGEIEILGRKDTQVKIRGFRVELSEIENVLRTYPDITSAVVTNHNLADGNNELVAYFISHENLAAASILSYLKTHLPDYMLPAYYIKLEKLPLTPHGKLDVNALPEPDYISQHSRQTYIGPRNEVERKVTSIWEQILERTDIGIKDNFFELGGHSIKIMKLVTHIHKEFNISLKVRDMFTDTTIETMSHYISRALWIKTGQNEIIDAVESDNTIIL